MSFVLVKSSLALLVSGSALCNMKDKIEEFDFVMQKLKDGHPENNHERSEGMSGPDLQNI